MPTNGTIIQRNFKQTIMKSQVAVIVPIYQPLSSNEQASLRQTTRILSAYPIIMLVPSGMDIQKLKTEFPSITYREVSPEWLGSKNGIDGYNTMMVSSTFYEMFSNYEYILICHVDAWVFKDELAYWCKKGYDCVAAPWIKKHYKLLNTPIIRPVYKYIERILHKDNHISHMELHAKIGNGGLSLRKVSTFRHACSQYGQEIKQCMQKRQIPEDVFWATIPVDFSYPTLREAVQFAFDTKPQICLKINGGQLPFGCHSWFKPAYADFWKHWIHC